MLEDAPLHVQKKVMKQMRNKKAKTMSQELSAKERKDMMKEQALELMRKGMIPRHASLRMGLHKDTVDNWLKNDEEFEFKAQQAMLEWVEIAQGTTLEGARTDHEFALKLLKAHRLTRDMYAEEKTINVNTNAVEYHLPRLDTGQAPITITIEE